MCGGPDRQWIKLEQSVMEKDHKESQSKLKCFYLCFGCHKYLETNSVMNDKVLETKPYEGGHKKIV